MVALPVHSKELLNALGPSADIIGTQVGQLDAGSLDKLKRLRSAYSIPTASLTRYQAAADRSSDLPPFGFNPHPKDALSSLEESVGTTYHRDRVAKHPTARNRFTALLDRHQQRAQVLAMAIRKRSDLRTAVERIAVGRILPDGRNDGVLTIQTNKKAAGMQSAAMVGQKIEQQASLATPELLKQFLDLYYNQASFGPFGLFASGMEGFSLDESSLDGSSDYGDSSDFSSPTSVGQFDQSSGLDTDILKLKRMIDKKSQATDLFSQTLTAYNNAAKNIIDKMRA